MKYLDVSERLAVERIAKAVEAFTLSAEVPKDAATQMKGEAKAVRLWAEVRQYGRAVAVAKGLLDTVVREGQPDAMAAAEVIENAIKTLERSA